MYATPARPRDPESEAARLTFLARYDAGTARTYRVALDRLFAWCDDYGITPLEATRAHLELFRHHLSDEVGLKNSTVYAVARKDFDVEPSTLSHVADKMGENVVVQVLAATVSHRDDVVDRLAHRIREPEREVDEFAAQAAVRPVAVDQRWDVVTQRAPPPRAMDALGTELRVRALTPAVGRAWRGQVHFDAAPRARERPRPVASMPRVRDLTSAGAVLTASAARGDGGTANRAGCPLGQCSTERSELAPSLLLAVVP